jgi:hypothetical protein
MVEKLNAPLVMENVQLISEQEQEAGYTETPFSFGALNLGNEYLNPDDMDEKLKKKQQERNKKEIEKKKLREKELREE